MRDEVWQGATVPQYLVIEKWLTQVGKEQNEVIDVWRILGALHAKDFTWDWRIRPEVERRQLADGNRFHAGRIEELMGATSNHPRRWSCQDAIDGGPGNRLPQMVKLHGFYWNQGDGNHRIVVAKRLGYPRMRVLSFQARLKPEVPSHIRTWIDRVERWATGRHDGSVPMDRPPPRSPSISVFSVPDGVRHGRSRSVVIRPKEPSFEHDTLSSPKPRPHYDA